MAHVNANGEEGNPNGRGAAQQPEQQPGGLVPNGAAAVAVPVPAQLGAAQQPNGAAPGAAAVALPAAAHLPVVVANPVIANLAGALAPPGLIAHPQFDVEAALLGPPATQTNKNFSILPIIQ